MATPIVDLSVTPKNSEKTWKGSKGEVHIETRGETDEIVSIQILLGFEIRNQRVWIERWKDGEDNTTPLAVMLALSPEIDYKYNFIL